MTVRSWKLALALAGSMGMTCCAVVKSEKLPGGMAERDAREQQEGVTYFLPRRMIKITATRKKADTDKRKDGARRSSSQPAPGKRSGSPAGGSPSNAASGSTAAATASANVSVDVKSGKVAESSQRGQGRRGNDTYTKGDTISISVSLLPPEPDPRAMYYARPTHSWLRDDVVTIGVNEKGLLTSSKVESTDRTADALVEIAKFSGVLVQGVLAPQAARKKDPKELCGERPLRFELSVDPIELIEGRDDHYINRFLEICFNSMIRVQRLGYAPSKWKEYYKQRKYDESPYNARADRPVAPPLDEYDGYAYRPALPYLVTVDRITGDDDLPYLPQHSVIVMLPNEAPTGYIPIRSSAFVKTVNDVTFKDGMIASWTNNRPSEVLEIVRLPLRLVSAFLEAPANIIKLRFNLDSERASLLEKQTAVIKAENELRMLKLCLDAAANDPAAAAVCMK